MDKGLSGSFRLSLDADGSLTIPAVLQQQISSSVMVAADERACFLGIYTEAGWKAYFEENRRRCQSDYDFLKWSNERRQSAVLLDISPDGQLPLPGSIIRRCGLLDTCQLIALGDSLQLWEEQRWYRHLCSERRFHQEQTPQFA